MDTSGLRFPKLLKLFPSTGTVSQRLSNACGCRSGNRTPLRGTSLGPTSAQGKALWPPCAAESGSGSGPSTGLGVKSTGWEWFFLTKDGMILQNIYNKKNHHSTAISYWEKNTTSIFGDHLDHPMENHQKSQWPRSNRKLSSSSLATWKQTPAMTLWGCLALRNKSWQLALGVKNGWLERSRNAPGSERNNSDLELPTIKNNKLRLDVEIFS